MDQRLANAGFTGHVTQSACASQETTNASWMLSQRHTALDQHSHNLRVVLLPVGALCKHHPLWGCTMSLK